MWRWTVSPEKAPDAGASTSSSTYRERRHRRGRTARRLTPAAVLTELNRLGGKHGIGRLDLVENRYVGMKSRGCYETPGRHDHAEGAPRDRVDHARPRSAAHLKDDLMPRYARMIYNGYWWSAPSASCCRR